MAVQAVKATRWSASALAREFGMDRRTIADKIRAANVQPIGTDRGNPVYAMADAARACFANEILVAGGDDFDPEALPPKERKDWYDGEEKRIKLEQIRGNLVTIDVYREELARVLKEVAMTLETLTDVLERKCNLPPETVIVMQSILDEQRTKLADSICE